MDNFFTSFRLLNHLVVNNIQTTYVHNKKGFHWRQTAAKKRT